MTNGEAVMSEINAQIESLKNLPAQCPVSINPEGLDWLRHALTSNITFDRDIMPYLYPTEDGKVQVEWTVGRFRADPEIRLDTRQVTWGYSDLSSDYNEERELNLKMASSWQLISETLYRWAQEAGR